MVYWQKKATAIGVIVYYGNKYYQTTVYLFEKLSPCVGKNWGRDQEKIDM